MTVTVQNTIANSTSTGAYLISRLNELADAMTNKVVTTDSNTATGNAAVSGSLQANALFVNSVSGGVAGVPANLNFTSNATFYSRVNLGGGANVYITTGNSTHRVLTVNTLGAVSAVKLTFSSDLSDVNAASVSNGSLLVYSNAESAWKSTAAASVYVGNSGALDGNPASYFTNASNMDSGTLASARLSGSYTGITAVGTLSSLAVTGNASANNASFATAVSAATASFTNATVSGTLSLPGDGLAVVLSNGSLAQVNASVVAANSITNTRLSNMNSQRIKGRNAAGAGSPEDLTPAEVRSILGLTTADIAGFGEAVEDQVATLLAAGTHTDISVTYTDASNKIDLAFTGSAEKLVHSDGKYMSSVSSVTFTGIPTCKRMEFEVVNINPTTSATLQVELSDDNGSSFGTVKSVSVTSGSTKSGRVMLANTGVVGNKTYTAWSVISDGTSGSILTGSETSKTGVTNQVRFSTSAGNMYGLIILKGYA